MIILTLSLCVLQKYIFYSLTSWLLLFLNTLVFLSENGTLLFCFQRYILWPAFQPSLPWVLLKKITHQPLSIQVMFWYLKCWKVFSNQSICTYHKKNQNTQEKLCITDRGLRKPDRHLPRQPHDPIFFLASFCPQMGINISGFNILIDPRR